MSLATRLLGSNPGVQVSSALSGSLTTPGAKGAYIASEFYAIQSSVLGSTSSTVTFADVPSTYTHLEVRVWASSATTNDDIYVRFNNDSSTSNYNSIWTGTNGTASPSSSNSITPGIYFGLNATADGVPWVGIMSIHDYKNSNNFKSAIVNSGSDRNGSGSLYHSGGHWKSQSAVTRVDVVAASGVFAVGSMFALYGWK